MVAIMFDQLGMEALCQGFDLRVIKAQARKATHTAAGRHAAMRDRIITGLISGIWKPAEGPLRCRSVECGDNDLNIVLRGKVHHPVIVGPVPLARSYLEC